MIPCGGRSGSCIVGYHELCELHEWDLIHVFRSIRGKILWPEPDDRNPPPLRPCHRIEFAVVEK